MAYVDRDTGAAQALGQLAGQGWRSMASAGASQADRQIALALAAIERHEKAKQSHYLVDEAPRLGLAHHVVAHSLVGSVERFKLGDKKRIRQKSHVQHQIHP